ncbi:lipoprotein [Bacteriovoracales bacterium]|nr:lipoprotein [Bacteriovoracales bacterium]
MKKIISILSILFLVSACSSSSKYSFPGNGTMCQGSFLSKKCYDHYGDMYCFDKYCW